MPPDARILCWLVECAAYLMNRCEEFGEKILYMPAKPARGGKWEPRFHPGVFVGTLNSSSEAVVVTEQGLAIKTRSPNMRKIPEAERWDAGFVNVSEWTITNARRVRVRLQRHASTRSGQRGEHNRDERTDRVVGWPSCSSIVGTLERRTSRS